MAAEDRAGVVTLQCSVGVDELLSRVVAQLEQRGLELFTVINHSGAADEVGLTMPDTKVVVFGNPKGGTPLMVAHPLVALDLPLKLLIWETADHDSFVSYNAAAYLAERYELSDAETNALRAVEVIAQAVAAD